MTLPRDGLSALPPTESLQLFKRWGHLAVALLLVMAFVTGGGSRDRGIGDVVTQLLALPLVVSALMALGTMPRNWMRHAALAVSALVVGTLVLQQLPLTESLWRTIAVRDALAQDLRTAGVGDARHFWSLSPLASERGLWSILPALAVFLGALAVPVQRHRQLLLLVVGLVTASLILGFVQLGAPQDSVLNPFPEWAPSLNGFFSNPNHQSTALAVSVVILVALAFADRGRESAPDAPGWVRFSMITLAAVLFAALPLTGSRAVMLLAVLALVAMPFLLRAGRAGATAHSVLSKAGSRGIQIALALVALGVILAAIGWLRHDIAEESRWVVAKVAAVMGGSHAPLGAGVGSFVPWFEQAAPAALILGEYYNHAHNEYAQWWLESGVLGVASVLAVITMLMACYPAQSTRVRSSAGSGDSAGDRGVAVAAWLGCALILAHSWVDFPLRTASLMTLAGLLAGIVVAQRIARFRRRPSEQMKPSLTSHATQRA